MRNSTMRSKIIFGFGIVTVPLLIFLIYNNWYAMQVVCDQAAGSNRNIVMMHGSQMDNELNIMDKYLQSMIVSNADLLSLSMYPTDSMEEYLANTNILNKLQKDIILYNFASGIFAYKTPSKELLMAAQPATDFDRIKASLDKILGESADRRKITQHWILFDVDGEYSMLRLMDNGYGLYIGAWINLKQLLKPLGQLEFGEDSQVLFVTSEGQILEKSSIDGKSGTIDPLGLKQALINTDKAYSLLKTGPRGADTMVISRRSQVSDIYLVVLLPVEALLKELTFFQWLAYLTPVVTLIFLAFYLVYLQKSIGTPMKKLINGMKKIRSGDLTARIGPTRMVEFNAINEAFNEMAGQIEHLKVDIYEEQILLQKAEMKHLQAQIHPHFFANCLNLIYSLAQVRDTELVKTLALQLVRHFRFMTRTSLTLVKLSDEVELIRNYLGIQKIRFPKALEYSIEIDPDIAEVLVPPLMIQPFVENAMEHGFCYRDDVPFTILIRLKQDANSPQQLITVRVEDNGKGFQPETMERLQSGEYFKGDSDGHIGIWNVQRRCLLYYKSEVSISFANREQGGAVVEMALPV